MAKKAKRSKTPGISASQRKKLAEAHKHMRAAGAILESLHGKLSGVVPPFHCSPAGDNKYWKCWWDPVEQAYTKNCQLVDASECP